MPNYINLKNKVVLIKRKGAHWFNDETKDISKVIAINKNDSDEVSYYYIYYGDSRYTYSAEAVKILNFIEVIDTSKYFVNYKNRGLTNAKVERYSDGFFKITFLNGQTIFTDKNVEIIDTEKAAKLFTYYQKIAQYALGLYQNEDDVDPLYFLAKNYMSINYRTSSSLNFYLSGSAGVEDEFKGDIIYPYKYNKSQSEAIKVALQSPISVIEGPPGTGKTETILNLICNIVASGSNVAIVSNNNSAVENVLDKFKEEGLDFMIARLGSNERIEEFFSENETDEGFNNFRNTYKAKPLFRFHDNIKTWGNDLDNIYKAEINIAKYQDEIASIRRERENRNLNWNVDIKMDDNYKSDVYKKFIERLYINPHFTDKEKIETAKYFKIRPTYLESINQDLIDETLRLYYNAKERELTDLLYQEKLAADSPRKEKLEANMKRSSLNYLFNKLHKRYYSYGYIEFDSHNFKDYFKHFVRRYPVIASTTHSLMASTNGYFFDYLIIDEASQADLLSSIIAMNCARKVVIVGDSKQLQAIGDDVLMDESFNLALEMDVPSTYIYNSSNSLLKSVKQSVENVPTTLLKEHYRCAPDIIRFCNEMFYGGELIPMTSNGENKHIHIIKINPGKYAHRDPEKKRRGFYNEKEIDEIVNIVKNWDPNEFGIITPFTLQVDKIRERLGYTVKVIEDDKTITKEVEGIEKALVSTIHKFQGQQRDKIALSFVVNSLEKKDIDIENRLYDFITNQQLLNVAISRAKEEIYVVVSDGVYHSKGNPIHDLIAYAEYLNSDNRKDINRVFVPDYFYKGNNDVIKRNLISNKEKVPSNNDELSFARISDELLKRYNHIDYIMHARLSDIAPNKKGLVEEELKFYLSPTTYIDFLFYNKVSKEPLFALDLISNREERDHREDLKKDLLADNNIKLYQVDIDDNQIKEKLNATLYKYSSI